tara:strand:+ start:174 stop:293 length:120 start_codon:yes stop_codon:yes gene_type:complete
MYTLSDFLIGEIMKPIVLLIILAPAAITLLKLVMLPPIM